ncbi:Serine/threonine-protein kinase LMTK3, partial [Orchesella cincta]
MLSDGWRDARMFMKVLTIVCDISFPKGLEWLHTAGFVHPDLAARNCQVSSENRVVIGDYGLGTQIYKDDYHWSSNIAIPLRWTAPETLHCTSSVIQILKVNESSNVWSWGVLAWEICEFGKLPYFELSDDEVISRVIIDKNYFLGMPTLQCMSAKEELYKIMSSCWQADLEHRPGLSTIISCLENLLKTFNVSATPPRDDFESKWEQLGSRTNSEEDKRRKKN